MSISALRKPFSFLLGLSFLATAPLCADVNKDVAFSGFTNVDVNSLASGIVLQSRGGLVYFERGIISQALYIVDAQPVDVLHKLSHWSPDKHPELSVWFHQSISLKPTLADFAGLATLPDNKSVSYQFDATAKLDPNNPALQVSKSEAQGIAAVAAQGGDPKAVYGSAWAPVLLSRFNNFLSGKAGSDVYAIGGSEVKPLGDIKSLLHADAHIYGQFQRFLNQTPVKTSSSAAIKLQPVSLYYDVFDVEGYGALAAGAIYQTTDKGPNYQSVDIEFFVNSGVYATVEMEQLWPVTVDGKAETLVWRGDLVSAPSIAGLHGTERLASGMIMLQDVKQGVDAFRSEFK